MYLEINGEFNVFLSSGIRIDMDGPKDAILPKKGND